MHRRTFILSGSLVTGLGSLSSLRMNLGKIVKSNVLLLGDSISIGYTPYVQQILSDIAEVTRPTQEDGSAENCQGTTNALQNLDRWLGETKWDVIHFNFGLHDLKHVRPDTGENSMSPKDPQQAPLKKYRKNLAQITERLLATGAHLIFATTTPYPNPVDGPLRKPGEPQKYNEAAVKIMAKHDIQVNDLYSFVKPQMEVLMRLKNVHFTEDGSKALADEVAKVIKEVVLRNP
ncbi:MAG: SGNH/GDSL hydrolase family protein [Saprospiraceae bacterium]|nr:SGNH/GDSL hydrolase family protein [Saprospiraceae bacterium]